VLAGAAAGLLVAGTVLLLEHRPIPISVTVAGAGFSLMGFGAIRFQSRLFGFRRREAESEPTRVLVVGAGDAGAMIVKDLFNHPFLDRDPVGLVDDDPRKHRATLHGVPVLGGRVAIPWLVHRLRVGEVLLAIPSATSEVVREVAGLCEEAEVPLRVLPSVRDVVGGRVTVRDIRDLKIEDLLGRRQIETDLEAVTAMLRGRRVLVTGAGGSIGSEIARQVAAAQPSALLLLDHDETHLHDLLGDLEATPEAEPVLADVRERDRILSVFSRYRPEVVFHAAAHKHVRFLEECPGEAVSTNVLGTANVADAAAAAGTRRFVLISTDKAVRPASVMGASKWFAERIVRSLDAAGCAFSSVRFGNVLGSRGSVIPKFLRQISRGGPVTVTDPAMTRYFMSVPEAVELVLQAAAMARGGEVFTLDMGEPVNILDLARKVIRLSGRVPGTDVAIEVIGAGPGEKLSEEFLDPAESPSRTEHPDIFASRPLAPDRMVLRAAIREMEALAAAERGDELAARMKAMASDRVEAIVDFREAAAAEGVG
jgi:FlaA1/EpsC-like NDP-sugar epimerase